MRHTLSYLLDLPTLRSVNGYELKIEEPERRVWLIGDDADGRVAIVEEKRDGMWTETDRYEPGDTPLD